MADSKDISAPGQALVRRATVLESLPSGRGHHLLRLSLPEIPAAIAPGQFVMLGCADARQEAGKGRIDPDGLPEDLARLRRRPWLKRPFGAFEIDAAEGRLSVLFRLVGKGTEHLSSLRQGDVTEIMGPLGRGFDLAGDKPALLIAGGIGIAPLAALAVELRRRGREVTVLAGMRDTDSFPLELERNCSMPGCQLGLTMMRRAGVPSAAASEAGETGTWRGLVTGLLEEWLGSIDTARCEAFICGPQIMMARTADMLIEAGIPGQALLEARMGCGVGGCMACVCKTKTQGNGEKHSRVCVDGPVFDIREVVW